MTAESVIVGRSVCAGRTWLLTTSPSLIRVATASRQVVATPVRNLLPRDRPWGLACIDDETLWTLAASRVLARIGPDGSVAERFELPQPWLALFAAGERVLYQPMPPAVGKPLLALSTPRQALNRQLWRGLVARKDASGRPQDFSNYVNCGIGIQPVIPCWLTDQRRIVVSDGVHARDIAFDPAAFHIADADRAAPIHDVALAGVARAWVLVAASDGAGRRAGGWLVRAATSAPGQGEAVEVVKLDPPARLIMWASERECVLLNARGELVEVYAR